MCFDLRQCSHQDRYPDGKVGHRIDEHQPRLPPAPYVVPATDPDVRQMIEFRDLLRRDPAARQAYVAAKLRIAVGTSDIVDYTRAKTALIRRLLRG